MATITKDPRVEEFILRSGRWSSIVKELRAISLDSGLVEDYKWDLPCYTHNGANIVVIQSFKNYCALLFLKGVLVDDPNGILQKTGENTKVGRQARFTDVSDVRRVSTELKGLIHSAIEVEKKGLKIETHDDSDIKIPEELESKFEEIPALREAWERLTPGRKRGYIYYFSAPKHSETREARIEKYIDRILDGIGLNDRYS